MFNFLRKKKVDLGHAQVVGSENFVYVVQVSMRAYPAVAIQGDELLIWKQLADELFAAMDVKQDEGLYKVAGILRTSISGRLHAYNRICKQAGRGGFKLPADEN